MNLKKFQSFILVGFKIDDPLPEDLGFKTSTNSPDLIKISSTKKSLGIEEIRNLKKDIFAKPLNDEFRLAIVEEAERLTLEAQNALLKIFEEPPQKAVIILKTKNDKSLLETIRSRAIIIKNKSKDINLESNLLNYNQKQLLFRISEVEDLKAWVENEIHSIYRNFLNLVKTRQDTTFHLIALKLCLEAKKMLDANVNEKHVTFGLVLSLKSKN